MKSLDPKAKGNAKVSCIQPLDDSGMVDRTTFVPKCVAVTCNSGGTSLR